MAREPIKKTIDGKNYTFYGLSPRKSLRILLRIFKIIGAPVGCGVDNINNESILNSDFNLGMVISKLSENILIDEVEDIINVLLEQVHCEGIGEVGNKFDEAFKGNLKHLFKVVKASLEVEYADFFDGKPVLESMLGRVDTSRKQ